jgi:hypothetical protein
MVAPLLTHLTLTVSNAAPARTFRVLFAVGRHKKFGPKFGPTQKYRVIRASI